MNEKIHDKIQSIYYPMLLWPVGIIFMHFSVFKFNGFNVNIAVLVSSLLNIYFIVFMRVKIKYIIVTIIGMIYLLTMGMYARNEIEYIKSMMLISNMLISFIISISVSVSNANRINNSVHIFLRLGSLVALLIITQSIAMNIFEINSFQNPFGPFSSPGPGGDIYSPGHESLLKRPNGIFSEPSVAGWFMTYVAAIALAFQEYTRKKMTFTIIVCCLAALASLSLSGFLNVILLSLVYIHYKHRMIKNNVIILTFIIIVLYLSHAAGIMDRFNNLFIEGSSIYYRVTAPLKLLGDSLPHYYFGHPVGQTEYIETKDYMVNWIGGSTTNIDNSFLLISYYFGLPGVVIAIVTICYAIYLVIKRRIEAFIIVSLLLALSETGSLWAHNMTLIMSFSIIIMRYIKFHYSRIINQEGITV